MDLKHSIIFSISLPFIILIIAPLTSYLGNHNEYTVGLQNIVSLLLFLNLIIASILLGLMWFLFKWPYLYKAFSGIIVGLALSSWIQSQLFVWNFGVLNGTEIQWTLWRFYAYVEILVWLLVISISLLIAYKKQKLLLILAQGVILMGVLSLMSTYFKVNYQPKKLPSFEHGPFNFHNKINKIIIVLDTFQSDAFLEIAQRWPEEINFLNGFTYYPNVVGGFSSTKISLPLIMSGSFYKNGIPLKDWMESDYANKNLADYFSEKKYGVSLVSIAPGYVNGMKSQTCMPLNNFTSYKGINKERLLVIDNGLFRAFPIKMKPYIYNDSGWFLYNLAFDQKLPQGLNKDDFLFLREFEKRAVVNSSHEGEFKLFHYYGAHPPANMNENLEYEKMPNTRESYIRHARGVLKILNRKLKQMRKLNIYDSAEILVIGDHGVPQGGLLPVDLRDSNDIKNDFEPSVLGGARPLFLHKLANIISPLVTSDKPLHLADVACIFSEEDRMFSCEAYHKANKNRDRRFFAYSTWPQAGGEHEFMPPMREYVIRGDVRDITAWNDTYIEYAEGTVKKKYDPMYQLGTLLQFTEAGNGREFLKGGWSYPEEEYCWTDGDSSHVRLHIKQNFHKDLTLQLYGKSFPAKGKEAQSVDVLVNGFKIITWQVLSPLDWYTASIPQNLIKQGKINIEFVIKEPTAPCDILSSNLDGRRLGISAQKLIINEQIG